MIETNAKKDIELLQGLYRLGIELQKLQEELSSDPSSNPQMEKLLQILSMIYPIWASALLSSGKRQLMSRMPRVSVRHAVMSPISGRNRWAWGWKPPKIRKWMFSPIKHPALPWRTRGIFNTHPAVHFFPKPSPGQKHRADEIPSKERHYRRNQLMSDLPQSPEAAVRRGWSDSVGAACHQFLSPDKTNIKYVSPDGHSEVIYDRDGHIVTASEDYGTYNFVDSRRDPIGHFYQDVLPWLMWGNDKKDSTDMSQRLRALVGYDNSEAALPQVAMETAGAGDESQ